MDKIKNTIIIAGLLHDVGKVMQRGSHNKSHPLCSGDFVNNYLDNQANNFLDLNILKILCEKHHEGHRKEECRVESINDQHLKNLALIISRADNYSSYEREEVEWGEESKDYRSTRLLSIFSKVNIGRGKPDFKHYGLGNIENRYIPGESLGDYSDLFTEFSKEAKRLNYSDFNSFLHGVINICEKYLWCVPSDPRTEDQDISLFDHLLTTSGIATCIYEYHKNSLNEEEIKNDNLEKFILIGGDLSGIQNFIFEIEQTNPQKLSKTLRGRSVYLSLLTTAISLKILNELELPLTCKILDAGGRFLLIAPNTTEHKGKLENLIKEINIWFLNNFLGKLGMNIDYISISGNDFYTDRFVKKIKELNYKIDIKKKQKFMEEYFNNNSTHNLNNVYDRYIKYGNCSFCGIYPRLQNEDRCQFCLDAEKIGDKIIRYDFITFSKNNAEIQIMDIGINFVNSIKANNYLVLFIGEGNRNIEIGYLNSRLRKHFPRYSETQFKISKDENETIKELRITQRNAVNKKGFSLCFFCKKLCSKDERIQYINNDFILSFQCIATTSLKDNQEKGVDHLGLFKADVDYLGIIMSKGINPMSVSRLASLSRMFNFFFTYVINTIIKTKFSSIYTIYAGGDDMVLIGPWEMLINFSIDMQKEFKKYVAYNPNITISGGISFFRPNTSIRFAVEEAEKNLEISKHSGKDSLTLFRTTVKWELMDKLTEFKNFLNNEYNDDSSNINSSFLYRLLKYHEMYLDAEIRNKPEGLIFHSLASYDVRRNIEKRDNKGNLLNPVTINNLEKLYSTGTNFDRDLMINLKIPVFWVLYKNRGG